MGVTIGINHPAFPEGTEFGIDLLGVVPNGGSLEVPDENVEMFENVKGKTVADAFTGNEMVTIGGSSETQNENENENQNGEEVIEVADENVATEQNANTETQPSDGVT